MKDYKLTEGRILRVEQDIYAESPNEWSADIFIVYAHRDFTVKREGFVPSEIFDHYNNTPDDRFTNYYVFPLYAYIHSGVSLSLNRGSDRWDTSFKGFVLVKKSCFTNISEAEESAENLVETWNQYLFGDVYQFVVIKTTECPNCHHIEETIEDSCGGFYGDDPKTNGMLEHFSYKLIEEEVISPLPA